MNKAVATGVAAVFVLAFLSLALSACGGTTTTTVITTPGTAGTSSTAGTSGTVGTSGTTGTPAYTTTGQGTTSTQGSNSLPQYQPSQIISQAPGSLQLTSPDSLSTVTAFYEDQLSTGNWKVVSDTKNAANTSITATKGSTGTTISISDTGNGCYISLVTYPV